jgi:pimeloyl-ACP methyl ester carboxylesterase
MSRMTTYRRHVLSCVASLLALCAAGVLPATAAPCVAVTADCSQWVTLGGGPARSLVYSSYPLDTRNERITRALVVVHGLSRNADNYFRTSVSAAFLADALDDAIVIAPRFAAANGRTCQDTLAADEINWTCTGNNWRAGGVAVGNEALTSFDLMDEILRRLARKGTFPNLKTIVVAGHSAGGQFVSRYEMANQVHDTLGVAVAYVVANPSAYAYLDSNRPAAGGEYRAYADSANCTAFDHWPYGLKERGGYAARLTDDQLKKQLVARPVTYMLGELDTLPLGGFDSSCPAMAQGPHRLARGQAFNAYIKRNHGTDQKLMVIPLCGHNARCMFTADLALPILFPKP